MADRGEKRKGCEIDKAEPVAKRTRLMCGTPIRRTVPVQYPREWVSGGSLVRHSPVPSNSKRFYERPSRCNADLPSTSKSLVRPGTSHGRYAVRGAAANKPLKSSLIQLVKVRSTRDQHNKGSRKARSKRGPVQRRHTGRNRVKGTCVRRRRKGRVRRKRPARRKRKPTTTTTKRRRRMPKRLLKRAQEMDKRKPAFKQSPPLGHEQDEILCKQNKNTTRNVDVGHDEILDDPLNVRNLCRYLVKSMQGMPADTRGSKENDDKADQQGSEEPDKEDNERRRKVKRRRYRKSRKMQRHRRRPHRKHRRRLKGRYSALKRVIDKHAKRGPLNRRRKLAHKWRNHAKSHYRAKVVQARQKASRSAVVARRRMGARRSRHQ